MGGDLVFQSSEVQQYTVLPGTYGLESYDYVLPPFGTFTVAADGTVDYDAALDSIFSGRGTTVLGIIAPNAMPTDCGVMRAGEGLRNGQSLSSCDGKFTLAIRDTGELLLYLDTIPVWLLDPDYYKKVLSGRIALSMRPDGTLVYEALDGYKSGSLGFPPGSPLFALNPLDRKSVV